MNLLKKIGNFIWSRAFLINFTALILLYILLFYVLKGCLDSSTHHGEKIEVPNLIGKNANNVEAILAAGDIDLKYEVIDSIYEPSKVAGTIMEQDPKPTVVSQLHVKSGRTIKLRVSKRTMLVEMPNLVNKSQRFAEGVLRNREFSYNLEYVPSTEAAGAVIKQLYKGKPIAPGRRIPIGSKIRLVVGRNEVGIPLDLPNLYGLSLVDARKRVESMLNMEFFIGACDGCANSADSASARVYEQSPAFEEGAVIASGGSITVIASKEFTESE